MGAARAHFALVGANVTEALAGLRRMALAAACVASLALAAYGGYYALAGGKAVVYIRVVRKESVGGKYLVFTPAEVFEDSDSLLHWKFDSSELYNIFAEDSFYRCRVYGWRIPTLGRYRNLIDCQVATSADAADPSTYGFDSLFLPTFSPVPLPSQPPGPALPAPTPVPAPSPSASPTANPLPTYARLGIRLQQSYPYYSKYDPGKVGASMVEQHPSFSLLADNPPLPLTPEGWEQLYLQLIGTVKTP